MADIILESCITGGRGYTIFMDDPKNKEEIMVKFGDNFLSYEQLEELKKDPGFSKHFQSDDFKILGKGEIKRKEEKKEEELAAIKDEDEAKRKYADEVKRVKRDLNAEIDRQKGLLKDANNRYAQDTTELKKKISDLEKQNSTLLGEKQKLSKDVSDLKKKLKNGS